MSTDAPRRDAAAGYLELLQAARTAARFVDPARVHLPEAIAARRGGDWVTAAIGRPYHELHTVSSVEATLIELADAAGIDPGLPQWLLDDRAESTAHERERQQQQQAAARARQKQVWADAPRRAPSRCRSGRTRTATPTAHAARCCATRSPSPPRCPARTGCTQRAGRCA